MATEKKPSRSFPYVLRLFKCVYPKFTVEGLENLPAEPCFIIGNHAQIHGPVISQLYLPENVRTWCAAEVMDKKEAQPYALKDFWHQKPANMQWFYRILSHVVAPLLVYLHTNGRTIGVYHDHRVMTTFRETLRRMEEGEHILIFPEKAVPDSNILCQFQEGFVDAAKLYHRRTGKRAAFVPMYIAPSLRKVVLGTPLFFNEENPLEEERRRICAELSSAITDLALSLPPHIVTPYMNVPKKEYPMSK